MIVFKPLHQARRVQQLPGGKQSDSVDTITVGMPENGQSCYNPCKQLCLWQQDTENIHNRLV